MKLRFIKITGRLFHLAILVGMVFTALIPIQLSVAAQGNSAPIQVVRTLYTSEYGVNDPKGLAFSPTANTFFVMDGSGNISLVTMGEDNAGSRTLPEVQSDALNVAFDKKSDSLFVFKRGKSELVKIKANGNGLPDASASSNRYAAQAFGIKDPQGIAFDPSSGRMFILDAGNSQIVSVTPHTTLGFDANEAIRSNKDKPSTIVHVHPDDLVGGHVQCLLPGPDVRRVSFSERRRSSRIRRLRFVASRV